MPKIGAFGVLVIDDDDSTPVRGRAIRRLGRIDRSLVFLSREHAVTRATLELDGADAVVPVLVTGRHIELIAADE